MANYTKGQRRKLDEIHALIAAAHRAGVCDGEGRSVENEQGVPVPKPRNYRPTHKWVKGIGWVEV